MKRILLMTLACSIWATGGFAQSKKSKNKTKSGKTETTAPAGSAFLVTENGLEYKMLKDVEGTPAKVGDFIEMHIITGVGDSVLFDSYKMNNNQPVPFQVQPAAFKGDIGEAFTMMSAGDSAIFRVPVDSVLKTGAQALPWMEAGKDMKISYTVHVLSVKTPEQMQADMQRDMEAQKQIDDNLLQEYFAANKIDAQKTASGLYYTISKQGTGITPTTGDSVSMNYTGKLMSGEAFDSNVDPKFQHVQPFWFLLGMRQVIAGWDEGVALLPQGTQATLYIPSGLAYGSQSPGPQIPANSVLIFDVEVVDVRKAGQ